jgi:hypothetical protein
MRNPLPSTCVVCILLMTLTLGFSAQAAGAADLCSMSQDEANASPKCVRWYFACRGRELGKPDERFASMPYKVRLKFIAQALYKVAEQNCEQFDYVQAKAALDARLQQIEGQ